MSAVYNFYFDEANGCQRAIITSGLWSERPTTGLTNGQRFYATDRNIEYAYNTTLTKWLSTQLFVVPLCWSSAGTPALFSNSQPPTFSTNQADSRYSMYVESVDIEWSSEYIDANDGYSATFFAANSLVAITYLYQLGRVNEGRYTNAMAINTEYPIGTNSFRVGLAVISGDELANNGSVFGVSMRYRLVG